MRRSRLLRSLPHIKSVRRRVCYARRFLPITAILCEPISLPSDWSRNRRGAKARMSSATDEAHSVELRQQAEGIREDVQRLVREIEKVIVGHREVIEGILIC